MAFIVGGARVPFAKSFTLFRDVTSQQLMTLSLRALVEKYKLSNKTLGDVALGAVMKSSKDWNLARESVMASGLSANTSAYDVQRACGTSLENTLQIALKLNAGMMTTGIAGGVDSNSDITLLFKKKFTQKLFDLNMQKSAIQKALKVFDFNFSDLKPETPAVVEPQTGLSMGQHCELMVKEWKISREAQDQLSFESHQKGAKAYDEGFYQDLVFHFETQSKDLILRKETTLEKLKTLKPVFDRTSSGTLTAGNSTALTDGSSAVLMCSEKGLSELQVTPQARFVDAQFSAVDFVAREGKSGQGLLMAPTVAVSQLLQRQNLSLQDFDYYEIHEAFAGQVLCTLKAWESDDYCKKTLGRNQAMGSIDRTKINIKGGSLALGHPFAATGTRIVGTLAKILSQHSGKGRGLISICTGGGMGVAAVLETV